MVSACCNPVLLTLVLDMSESRSWRQVGNRQFVSAPLLWFVVMGKGDIRPARSCGLAMAVCFNEKVVTLAICAAFSGQWPRTGWHRSR